MKQEANNSVMLVGAAVVIGFAVGYFAAEESSGRTKLQAEVARLQLMLDQTRRSAGSEGTRARWTLQTNAVGSRTNKSPSLASSMSLSDIEVKQRRDALDALVARTAAENNDEYTSIFSQLRASPELTERFKSNLVELHQKAISAGEPLRDLMVARVSYDKSLRLALGDENYARYRQYEESKPAVREYKLIEEYASKTSTFTFDPALSEKIIQLVRDARATTTETWHGPYDPLPHPAYGQEMVTNRMSQELLALKENSKVLLESTRRSGIPDEYGQLLSNYYEQRIRAKTQELEFSSLPEEERRKQADKFFEEQASKQLQEQARNSPRR